MQKKFTNPRVSMSAIAGPQASQRVYLNETTQPCDEILKKLGVKNINHNDRGNTVLHLGLFILSLQDYETLIKTSEINIDRQNQEGHTPLSLLCSSPQIMNNSWYSGKMIEILIENGARHYMSMYNLVASICEIYWNNDKSEVPREILRPLLEDGVSVNQAIAFYKTVDCQKKLFSYKIPRHNLGISGYTNRRPQYSPIDKDNISPYTKAICYKTIYKKETVKHTYKLLKKYAPSKKCK